jgi:TrmH family RNA methyltransferase
MTFEQLKGLKDKAQREAQGFYLAEGEHLVLELGKALVRRPALAASRILVSHEYLAAGLPAGFPTQLPMETLNARHIGQLSDTRSPQGVIAVVPILPTPPPAAGERAVYLHEIQDPGNLGTILRTLAWFGGFRCLLTPDSVDPYNAKVVRAGMGASFHVPVEIDVPLESLPARHARIACLDTQGAPVQSAPFRGFDCYLFGNEARGLPREALATTGAQPFTIAGCHAIESLNLAAAVNICVYELERG